MVRVPAIFTKIHSSHPSLSQARPPRPPNVNLDTRDDKNGDRVRSESEGDQKSQSDYGSVISNDTSLMSVNKKNDYIIQSIKEALAIQKRKLGDDHPSVTRTLHSLALEYKVRGRYEKALQHLREALALLAERMAPFSNIVSENEDLRDDASIGSCESSICASSVESFASSVPLTEAIAIHEEQSVVYSCMGNIYMLRCMYKEAADCYINSVNNLIEADYDGASTRVIMILRILKRAEFRRRNHKQTRSYSRSRRKLARTGSSSSPDVAGRRGSASSFDSNGIKAVGSSFETSGASWSSVGQMSI